MPDYVYSLALHRQLRKTAQAASLIKTARYMRKFASGDSEEVPVDPEKLLKSVASVGKDAAGIFGTGLYAVPGAAIGGSAGYLAGLLARSKNPGRWAALSAIAGGAAGAGYGAYRTAPLRKAVDLAGDVLPAHILETGQGKGSGDPEDTAAI